ncbi:MAG TPA: glycosyltransferase family 4 protein [Azospirillum sp.]
MTAVAFVGDFPLTMNTVRGGVEASTAGLAQALTAASDGTSVAVFAVPKADIAGDYDASVNGVTVHYFRSPMRRQVAALLCLPRMLRRFRKSDIRVAHLHGTNIITIAMMAALKAMRIPTVLSVHGIVGKECRDRFRAKPSVGNAVKVVFYGLSEWFTVEMADAVIGNTPYVVDYFNLTGKSKAHVIPQGIFLQDWRVAESERQPWRSRHVVSIGTFSRRKGHHLLIEAFSRVLRQGTQARLTIIGATTDRGYLEELRELVLRLGVQDAVELRSDLGREELLRTVRASRLFALHSEEESQGIALCEAMAAGLPVVATDVGGIPDVVEQGQSGLLSPYGDVDTFAAHLKRMLDDDALVARMSANAVHRAAGFTWESTAQRTQTVYAQVLRA